MRLRQEMLDTGIATLDSREVEITYAKNLANEYCVFWERTQALGFHGEIIESHSNVKKVSIHEFLTLLKLTAL